MKLPRLDTSQRVAPAIEELLAQSRSRRPEPLPRRERITEAAAGLALVAASIAMAATIDVSAEFEWGPAIVLTLAYAIAAAVRFYVGAGHTDATQLVFVPMLFVIPPPLVPLFVAAGLVLSKLPDVIARRDHPDRLILSVADSWVAVGPALVFALTDSVDPDWGDVPIYVVALLAQWVTDLVASSIRLKLALGISPGIQLSVLRGIWLVDGLMSPIALAVAFAAGDEPYRTLLVMPLVGLLAVFAQEREAHVESTLELSTAYRGTALLLGDVLEDKDAYTASHSYGVLEMSLRVSDALGLDPAARRRVEFGALLHDIGKIAVPGEIINKPGPLDDDEWEVMKLHTVEGQQMLDRIGGVLGDVGRVVRSSHEHWDGSGYPDGLAGEAIPVESRIVTACDAFSAMTTTRSYRKAMSLDDAKTELAAHAGTQFDPTVVQTLLEIVQSDPGVVTGGAEAARGSANGN